MRTEGRAEKFKLVARKRRKCFIKLAERNSKNVIRNPIWSV